MDTPSGPQDPGGPPPVQGSGAPSQSPNFSPRPSSGESDDDDDITAPPLDYEPPTTDRITMKRGPLEYSHQKFIQELGGLIVQVYSQLGEPLNPNDNITAMEKLTAALSPFSPRVELREASVLSDINPRELIDPSPDAIHYAICRGFDTAIRDALELDSFQKREKLLEISRMIRCARKLAITSTFQASKEERIAEKEVWLKRWKARFEEILGRIREAKDSFPSEERAAFEEARMIP